jgi:hypothetical protein
MSGEWSDHAWFDNDYGMHPTDLTGVGLPNGEE